VHARRTVQVIMEGPEASSAEAQARLVKCMSQPFVRDRAALHRLKQRHAPSGHANRAVGDCGGGGGGAQLSAPELEQWDACYHCGMRLDLTVDSNVADTWYDAK
jgi:hypothetical protein